MRLNVKMLMLLGLFSAISTAILMIMSSYDFFKQQLFSSTKNLYSNLRAHSRHERNANHYQADSAKSNKSKSFLPVLNRGVSGTPRKKKSNKRDIRLGKLFGGPAKCRVYDISASPLENDFNCIQLDIKIHHPRYICLHPLNIDKYISFSIERDGLWEGETLKTFTKILLSDNELGVIDIGANIGIYSIVAAALGHKVVAVEPFLSNLKLLHKAIKLNNIESNIIVLQNALSNHRGTYELSIPENNLGGVHLTSQDADRFCEEPEPCPPHATTIVMNDLLEVTNFRRGIIKIDIEGHEHRALRVSRRFFEEILITHIFMEWQKLRSYYGSGLDDSEDKQFVVEMLDLLKHERFRATNILTGESLNLEHWNQWPDDILWIHEDLKKS